MQLFTLESYHPKLLLKYLNRAFSGIDVITDFIFFSMSSILLLNIQITKAIRRNANKITRTTDKFFLSIQNNYSIFSLAIKLIRQKADVHVLT
jgi:hypothetical protein